MRRLVKTTTLSTIITRVRRVISKSKELGDQAKIRAVFPHAWNLVEYLTYEKDFSNEDVSKAKQILMTLGLPFKVDETDVDNYNTVFHTVCDKNVKDTSKIEPLKIPARKCRRCGRELSSKISTERGMGPVCWSKTTKREVIENENSNRNDMIEGIEVLEKLNDDIGQKTLFDFMK